MYSNRDDVNICYFFFFFWFRDDQGVTGLLRDWWRSQCFCRTPKVCITLLMPSKGLMALSMSLWDSQCVYYCTSKALIGLPSRWGYLQCVYGTSKKFMVLPRRFRSSKELMTLQMRDSQGIHVASKAFMGLKGYLER